MARSKYEVAPHWHCCPRCRQRYEDTCHAGDTNRECLHCRTGMGWALLRANREPRDCCRTHSRLLTDKKELARLSLLGGGNWWICATRQGCGRTQGYDPTQKTYSSTPTPQEK